MSDDIGVVGVAKRAAVAIEKGEIDQAAYAKLQERLAQEQFPNDSIGVALSKFYSTPHGSAMLNRGLQKNREDMQRSIALSVTVPLSKAWGNPASRQSEYENPSVTKPSSEPAISAGEIAWPDAWNAKVFDKAVAFLMREKNVSRDAAITEIYRAEKRRKGLSY